MAPTRERHVALTRHADRRRAASEELLRGLPDLLVLGTPRPQGGRLMSAEVLQLPAVGEVIGEGRFELRRQLGEGGMSTVFVAVDRQLGREVALKLLIPRYVGRPDREQRLINEAEYLRRVQGHPHIIESIDAGRLRDRNGWPWLSTEILAGEDLDWPFSRGTVAIPRVMR